MNEIIGGGVAGGEGASSRGRGHSLKPHKNSRTIRVQGPFPTSQGFRVSVLTGRQEGLDEAAPFLPTLSKPPFH